VREHEVATCRGASEALKSERGYDENLRTACLIFAAASAACAPIAIPDDGEQEPSTPGTFTAGTSSNDSIGGCTLPGSHETDVDVAERDDCIPIDWAPIDDGAFTGRSGCDGMPESTVLENGPAVAAHHDAWCAFEQGCGTSPPPCGAPPELPQKGERIVYVHDATSGCAIQATISELLDCGDAIEVHYRLGPPGCDALVHSWASAAIPCGPTPVVFLRDD
jgi:hypothetical protein